MKCQHDVNRGNRKRVDHHGRSKGVTVLWIFAVMIIQCVAATSETQFTAKTSAPTRMHDGCPTTAAHAMARMQVGDKANAQSNAAVEHHPSEWETHSTTTDADSAIIAQQRAVFFAANIFPRDADATRWNNAPQASVGIKPDALADNEPSFMGVLLSTPKRQEAGRQMISDSRQSEKQRRHVIDDPIAASASPHNKSSAVDVWSTTDLSYHSPPPPQAHQPVRNSSMAPPPTSSTHHLSATTATDFDADAINTTAAINGDYNEFSTIANWWENSTEYLTANATAPHCDLEEEGISCTIDHSVVCVGKEEFCNITQDEYMEMLYLYIRPTPSEWILIISHLVVFVMGLVGNALVCMAVYTNYTMRTVTNFFIVNLAVADFFVILFCLPPTVVWDVTETWFMGKMMCKVVIYFQTVSVTVSVLTLTFISIDRWYAICFPLRYVSTNMRAAGSIAFIWIVAAVSDIPEAVYSTTKRTPLRFNIQLFTQCVSTWDKNTEKWFYIGRFVLLYLLPLLLMSIAYTQIVRVLWKSDTIPGHRESRNATHGYVRSGFSGNASTMGQLRARRKAAKMLVAVVVMFASCFLPVHALNITRYTIDVGQNNVVTVLSLFSHWLCYANSAINPVIYNFMSGKFRREFRHALEKCRCGRARIEDRSLYHSTPASRMHISPSSRSNYTTTLRDVTLRERQTFVTSSFNENGINGLHGNGNGNGQSTDHSRHNICGHRNSQPISHSEQNDRSVETRLSDMKHP